MATAEATREFSAATQRAGRQDCRLDPEGGQGTERLPGRSPRHQAGRRRRRDDGGARLAAAAAAAGRRKTEFDVVLEGFGDKKIGVIKVVRAVDQPGPEGSQGPGRRRSQQGQGRHLQGRRREAQEGTGRSRRQRFRSSNDSCAEPTGSSTTAFGSMEIGLVRLTGLWLQLADRD